jgi:SAM-dependent methyltransferase
MILFDRSPLSLKSKSSRSGTGKPPATKACLLCSRTELVPVRPYRTHTRHGRAMFEGAWLDECAGCRLVQVFPRPAAEQLGAYYAEDYRSGGWAGSNVADLATFPRDNLALFNRGHAIAELVAPHLRGQGLQILDVGAGYGHVLHVLGEKYLDSARLAIEFSSSCIPFLEALGIEVVARPVEEVLANTERRFDLVVLSHVLEHLLDPRETLQLIRSRLTPTGLLYIEVPNIPPKSHSQHLDHRLVPHSDEPHITFFSTGTLQELLKSCGFKLLMCETAGPRYRNVSALGFRLVSLRRLAKDLLPRRTFIWLRQRFIKSIRAEDRDESFFQYGGCRIWLRSLATGGDYAS